MLASQRVSSILVHLRTLQQIQELKAVTSSELCDYIQAAYADTVATQAEVAADAADTAPRHAAVLSASGPEAHPMQSPAQASCQPPSCAATSLLHMHGVAHPTTFRILQAGGRRPSGGVVQGGRPPRRHKRRAAFGAQGPAAALLPARAAGRAAGLPPVCGARTIDTTSGCNSTENRKSYC